MKLMEAFLCPIKGERRSAEEESRKIRHERFIRFTKGDFELECTDGYSWCKYNINIISAVI